MTPWESKLVALYSAVPETGLCLTNVVSVSMRKFFGFNDFFFIFYECLYNTYRSMREDGLNCLVVPMYQFFWSWAPITLLQ